RRTGLHWEALMLAKLAEARLGSGDAGEAASVAEEAVRLAHARATRLTEAHARLALAHALRRRDGARAREAIGSHLDRAPALLAEAGAALYEPFVRIERAALARLAGDEVGRERELGTAARQFTAMDAAARARQLTVA